MTPRSLIRSLTSSSTASVIGPDQQEEFRGVADPQRASAERIADIGILSNEVLRLQAELARVARALHDTRLEARSLHTECALAASTIQQTIALVPPRLMKQRRAAAAALVGNEKAQRRLLAQSHFFNGGWYSRMNPDVRDSGLNPALHYLRIGAADGRDPGPAFSTHRYLELNPGVYATGINPLVHYLVIGRAEGLAFGAEDDFIWKAKNGTGA